MSSRHEIPSKQDGHVVTVGWDNPLQTFFAQVENQRAPEPESMVLWLGGQPREHTAPETMVAALRPYAELGADMLKTLNADRTADINRAPTPMQQAWVDMLDKQEPDARPTAPTPPLDSGARAAAPKAGSGGVRSPQTGTTAGTAQPLPAEDPIKKLVGDMQEAAGQLGPGEQRLKQTVETIATQVQEPSRVQDPASARRLPMRCRTLRNSPTRRSSLTQCLQGRWSSAPSPVRDLPIRASKHLWSRRRRLPTAI